MKKFMVTILAAILGSLGYIVVDQSIEERMAVLEEQVSELQEQNSQMKEQNSVLLEASSEFDEARSLSDEKHSEFEEEHSLFEEKHTEILTAVEEISSNVDKVNEEISELNSKYEEIKSSYERFIYPVGFSSRIMPDIYRTGSGSYYADFDITEHKIKGGTEIYISPNGNDSNPGTKDAPKRTFRAAFADKSCTTVYLLEGTYNYGEHYSSSFDVAGKNIIGIGSVRLNNANEDSSVCLHSSGTAYLENLDINGGNRSFYATLGMDEYLYINNCSFHDCESGNALTITGGNSYLVDCVVYNAYLDGFNYHKNASENAIPCAVEINCKAYNIGNSSNHSCNGSTIHDGGSIIRIGGEYYGCHGGNIADTGSSEQVVSYSLNLAVYSHRSTQSNPEYPHFNSGFWARFTKMWLYDCKVSSTTYDITALNGSTVCTADLGSDKIFSDNSSYTDSLSTILVK